MLQSMIKAAHVTAGRTSTSKEGGRTWNPAPSARFGGRVIEELTVTEDDARRKTRMKRVNGKKGGEV